MWKAHAVIEARKLQEGEEQEMRIRESEVLTPLFIHGSNYGKTKNRN